MRRRGRGPSIDRHHTRRPEILPSIYCRHAAAAAVAAAAAGTAAPEATAAAEGNQRRRARRCA